MEGCGTEASSGGYNEVRCHGGDEETMVPVRFQIRFFDLLVFLINIVYCLCVYVYIYIY